ncbi:hypothetical protein HOD96_01495 [Candidatus Falkowbacteria bacterium]|nr:hypothetical protein [Candidatus Falkowbacteria bacterium]MBT4433408.1 hypothetical protein [Candidatus Falkowbacteria bacterium]
MSVATLVSWSAWGIILFLVNPFEADVMSFLFFYVSLFFSLLGTIAIIGALTRRIFIKDKMLFRQVIVSFRQAVFISFLIMLCLLLQGERLLTWWNIMLLIAAVSVIELFAISKKQKI